MPDPRSDAKTVLDHWLTTTPYHPRTRTNAEEQIGLWLERIGDRVWTATPRDVDEWAGTDGHTRARRISALRGFYDTAADTGHVRTNPARRVARGSLTHLPGRRTLTRGEAADLISAADLYTGTNAARNRALIYLLVGLEARPGQITALLMEHLHREQHRLTADLPQKGGGTALVEIPRRVAHVLDAYTHPDTGERHWAAPYSGPDWGPLLTTAPSRGEPGGQPLTRPRVLLYNIRKVAAASPLLVETFGDGCKGITVDGVALSPNPWD